MPEKNLHIQKDASQTANMSKYEQAFQKYDLQLNDDAVKAAVEKLLEEKSAQYNTPEVLRYLLSTIELTTLTCNDSDESVLAMVEKYNKVAENHPDLPPFSALVTYPRFVDIVSKSLEVEGTKAACVVGGFPSSQTFIEIKTTETALSIKDGAEECDMVLSVLAPSFKATTRLVSTRLKKSRPCAAKCLSRLSLRRANSKQLPTSSAQVSCPCTLVQTSSRPAQARLPYRQLPRQLTLCVKPLRNTIMKQAVWSVLRPLAAFLPLKMQFSTIPSFVRS